MSRIFRILTAILVISAVGISMSYAETIWEKRQKALKEGAQPQQATQEAKEEKTTPDTYEYDEEEMEAPVEQITLDPTDPFNIAVPAMYGTVIESNKGTNGSLIIHIQDAHANYEAQKNIAGILESLMGDYGIKLVLLEGKVTDKDFTYIREKAPLAERIQKADKLLKRADINAVNYINIATDYPIAVQGIEDKAIYDSQTEALWEMDKFKNAALDYVTKMTQAADSLKAKIYNEELLAIDKAKKDYENETTDLLAYYKDLNGIIQKKNIGIAEFPNFSNLMKVDELERKIDLVKVGNNTATDEEKKLYEEYQQALKDLNVNKIFKEEPLLEKKIQSAVSQTPDQERLYRISRALSVMDKMLRVKLVPEEFNYFLENKKDFDPMSWADFIKQKSDELALDLLIPSNFYAISDNLPKIERFYSIAGERDAIFVKKSEARMKRDNTQIAALVAGGFHTPTLTRLLADAGYSYVVISPRVTTPTDDGLYRSRLKWEWLPDIK